MVSLILNCFAAEVAPTTLNLPYMESASWESSRDRLRQLTEAISYRQSVADGVRAILLSGPDQPEVDGTEDFDVGLGQLGARIIDSAIAGYLRDRGMETEHTSFETTALTRTEVVRRPRLIHWRRIQGTKAISLGTPSLHRFNAVEGQHTVCSEPLSLNA